MLTKTMALVFMTIILTSCGSKEEKSSVHLKIFQSSITSASNGTSGGVLLMGKSEDGKESFRMGLTSTSENVTLDLAKGRWEFAAVSWSGANGPLTGDNRCAYSEIVDLKDAEASITFNLSMSRCLKDFNGRQFSHPDYVIASGANAGNFLEFYPVICMDNVTNSATCTLGTNSSQILSYKIIYKGDSEGTIPGTFPSLSSNCLQINGATRARIPVTDAQTDSPFNVTLIFYTDLNCSVGPLIYELDDGLKSSLPVWTSVAAINPYYSYFYLNPGPMYDLSSSTPFGFTLLGLMNGASPSRVISYSIYSHPANASMMCFTTSSECSVGEWMALSNNGTYALSSTLFDGSYILKLFYKTAAGVVSTTPYSQNVLLDLIPPAPVINVSVMASVASGIQLHWEYTDASFFSFWMIETCSDASCSSITSARTITTLATADLTIPTIDITNGITSGTNTCVKISMADIFSRITPFIQCATASM